MMLVSGPAAALWQVVVNAYMPDRWIAWLSVQFTNALGSGVLLTAGLMLRRNPSAHKRLMLLGTIAVTEPGFSRIWLNSRNLGRSTWPRTPPAPERFAQNPLNSA